jgi:transcriptional regulator with XRE-family HTH domain
MTKRFSELVRKLPKEQRDRIAARRDEILADITLRELRQAFHLTQQQLAETLKVNQAAISKMESQSDMYISTLRRFLEAMGGKLKIVAEFADGEIVIKQFHQEDQRDGAKV